MDPQQFKIVSKLELHPPTEVTEEQLTKEYVPSQDDQTLDSVPRSTKPPRAMGRKGDKRLAVEHEHDDILGETGRVIEVDDGTNK